MLDRYTSDRLSADQDGRQFTVPLWGSFSWGRCRRRCPDRAASDFPSGDKAGYSKSARQVESTDSALPSRSTHIRSDEALPLLVEYSTLPDGEMAKRAGPTSSRIGTMPEVRASRRGSNFAA